MKAVYIFKEEINLTDTFIAQPLWRLNNAIKYFQELEVHISYDNNLDADNTFGFIEQIGDREVDFVDITINSSNFIKINSISDIK